MTCSTLAGESESVEPSDLAAPGVAGVTADSGAKNLAGVLRRDAAFAKGSAGSLRAPDDPDEALMKGSRPSSPFFAAKRTKWVVPG